DKVAASGGYMMACLGDKIVAAPFAILGSIGVVAEVPNIHKLLKKHDIDVDVLTAGEHKRSLTVMGENTRKGKDKFMEDLQITHDLFKNWVAEQRPQVNIKEVANGDVWYGQQALANNLVDQIGTSDDYLQQLVKGDASVVLVSYEEKKSVGEKLGLAAAGIVETLSTRLWSHGRRTNIQS
ncbi:MAG: protease SohB, partial [Gammaproteobacteria bacterium]|nr:protease SohB [Gammaproteobacteria bacterium]